LPPLKKARRASEGEKEDEAISKEIELSGYLHNFAPPIGKRQ
jgi:hypothetical protein